MKPLRKIVDKAVDYTMRGMFILIFLVVLMQILYRYVLQSPLVWSEELSRIIFIWVSLVGWVLATRHGTHIRITFFQERLPVPIQKFLDFSFKLVTLAFLGVLVWLGVEMSRRTFGRGAVTIPRIPMGLVYASLPVSAILGIFYVIMDIVDPSGRETAAPATPEAGGDAA
jgi:TRAP-type C4-dicarboxylate transport system permease small subunit